MENIEVADKIVGFLSVALPSAGFVLHQRWKAGKDAGKSQAEQEARDTAQKNKDQAQDRKIGSVKEDADRISAIVTRMERETALMDQRLKDAMKRAEEDRAHADTQRDEMRGEIRDMSKKIDDMPEKISKTLQAWLPQNRRR